VALPDALSWDRLLLRAYAATAAQEGLGVLAVPVKP
jgi:hypothetical protein